MGRITPVEPGAVAPGRLVRNLALSLSGGALLTLLGASAAHAGDLSDAGAQSDGSGAAHSGDATAVGNQSGSNTTQTGASGSLGSLQVASQQGAVTNTGVAVANTGGNVAVGNRSNNDASGSQTGTSGLGPAANSGTVHNASNGSAAVSTGNASAIGNQSTTTLDQGGSAQGTLGGILIISQGALVTNSGVALANTGGNTATGNESVNTAGLVQGNNLGAGLATNSGKASNGSEGQATIHTGNASAVGNKSDSAVVQSANGSAGGALGGLVLIDQNALVTNLGAAVANTGANTATGNSVDNVNDLNPGGVGALVNQQIGEIAPSLVGVGSNTGEASNQSDGDASITTGDATATGNDSTTEVTQDSRGDLGDEGGAAIATQQAGVVNAGLGVANSGLNVAVGNAARGDADVSQDVVGDVPLIGVASNTGSASNTSDGSSSIVAGKALAVGNTSHTDLTQTSEANGGALNLLPQVAAVQNVGLGVANTGLNAAIGNRSNANAGAQQSITTADAPGGVLAAAAVLSNAGDASNTSDGHATVTTGAAVAMGNTSTTTVDQAIDPDGLVIPIQVAEVLNGGLGVANSGANVAVGNASDVTITTDVSQFVTVGDSTDPADLVVAGLLVASNDGSTSNTSDGTASVHSGAASAAGNDSTTQIGQTSDGSVDGLGLVVDSQVAGVANVGAGIANSGLNVAAGNASRSDSGAYQEAVVGGPNGGDTTVVAGILTATNTATVEVLSDGDASIVTGNATAAGNASTTQITQAAGGEVSGLGGVLNTQVATVVNAGLGVANSGLNLAVGHGLGPEGGAQSGTGTYQHAAIGSEGSGDNTVVAPLVTASNTSSVTTSSDGTAAITTGAADATGNASSTQLDQHTDGEISGLGLSLSTQVAGVVNAGLGVANSGANVALGNISDNNTTDSASVNQTAHVGSGNDADSSVVAGLVAASNVADASTGADGTAEVTTGAATAHGNVSGTRLTQDPDSSVDGAGLVIGTQVAGVANVGVGVANSGVNVAVGNAVGLGQQDGSQAPLLQDAEIGSINPGGVVDLTALSAIAANQGSSSNTSDGHAKVKTGKASATGNASDTALTQAMTADVHVGGAVIGTQVGGVANVGLGVANSGANVAVGNASRNAVDATQRAYVVSNGLAPAGPVVVVGPVVASNAGDASNSSDGEACACTGEATASGNESTTTLDQGLVLTTGSGLVVVTEAGGVLNAGLGIANSGANLALGNVSDNTATLGQSADADPDPGLVGPQVASSGGGASNTSDGTAKVASGKASGTGNRSTTAFEQAATVDSALATTTLSGGTANAGVGFANAGLNRGVGNDSTNVAQLIQEADGTGVVSNQGDVANQSDGTAIIGDPSLCDDVPGETPGSPSLPRTGGELEVEAAVALMLLLAGFGLRRAGRKLA